MEREKFVELMASLTEDIRVLNVARRDMKNEYLENAEFEVGDNVVVTDETRNGERSRNAFIGAVNCHEDGEIYYKYLREKKDGTPSKLRLDIWIFGKIISVKKIENVEANV